MSLLDRLLALSDRDVEVRSDPGRMRPSDLPVIIESAEALRAATGWPPRRDLDAALRDVLNAERARLT